MNPYPSPPRTPSSYVRGFELQVTGAPTRNPKNLEIETAAEQAANDAKEEIGCLTKSYDAFDKKIRELNETTEAQSARLEELKAISQDFQFAWVMLEMLDIYE